jgi:carboxyl-terminal processing protease
LHESNDRYNDILSKAEVSKFSQGTDGKQIGLGLDLVPQGNAKSDSGLVIDRVFSGGPADKAGLKPNDKILAFNGEDVTGIDRNVLGKRLMETGGKDFRFTIERDGQKLEIVTRVGEYEVPAVRDMVLPGNVAYFRLKNFSQKDTTDELKAAILKHHDVTGLVIDLRSNPGGLLPEGLRAVTLFNDHSNIMSIRQRKDSDPAKPEYDERTLKAEPGRIVAVRKGEEPLWEYNGEKDIVSKPVVILTDGETASAAEIFAGALKDNGDAIIVGETTLGKGIGQSILFSAPDTGKELPEGGAVKVTSFRYFTPSGQWLGDGNNDRHGIEPNIVVHKDSPLSPGMTNDEQVNVALKYIEAVGKQNTPKS